jgi:2-keto-4-pentenoate hydratase
MTRRTVAPTFAELGAELRRARLSTTPVRALTDRFPEMTADEAYEIQRHVIAADLSSGRRRVGHKIGLTSKVMQDQLGVSEPDFGVVLDDMVLESGVQLDPSRLIEPRLQAEIAVIMQHDLEGPGVTLRAVARAVGYAVAAIEVIDSRIAAWHIKLPDTIADNASSGLVVVNDVPSTMTAQELKDESVELQCDGVRVAAGTGAAILADPLVAVRYLANQLGRNGMKLAAGELVLAGAMHPSIILEPGRHYLATYRSGIAVEFTSTPTQLETG